MFNKILVPVDFEQQSDKAVRSAATLARDASTSITLAHVYDANGSARVNGYVVYTPDERRCVAESLQQRLDMMKSSIRQSGVQNIETCLLDGKAAPELLRVAREGNYDLIIMGTHGRTGIWLKLLGSVAQSVLNEAPCTVMTVRVAENRLVDPLADEPCEFRPAAPSTRHCE
jgi:nucleotide-binding universal stress UspA family protein